MTHHIVKKLFTLITLFSCCFLSIIAQGETSGNYPNYVYNDYIKSVKIHRSGWKLSPPLINLNSDDVLEVSFDDLKDEQSDYYYTIIQCNSKWEESELVQQDYLNGFYENPIKDYTYSSNTTVPYIHYSFSFPNEDLKINLSGNYVLVVYRDFNRNDIIFTRRFYVYENIVDIDVSAKRPSTAEHFTTGQQIDISVNYEGYTIDDPNSEIKTVILQNLDWNQRKSGLRPTFIRNNELIYDYNHENIFNGNSEFRYFDIKSLRYQSEYVKDIKYDGKYHHVLLGAGEERHFGKYFYNEDINGKYLIEVQEFNHPENEADYVMVHFTLPLDLPVADGNVYVYGELSDWRTDERCKMEYNYDLKAYQARLLLKQGYYNYYYATKLNKSEQVDISHIEGSHYETENDYFIFVYHRPFQLRYDRLVGAQVANSVRKKQE